MPPVRGRVLRSDDAGTTWARVQNPFSAVAVGCLMFRALAPVLAASTAQPAGKLDALVSRIAQAYGGEKALARIKAFRETGTLESPRGVARTVRVFAAPDRLRVEIVYPGGGGEVRVVDGRDGWRNGEPVMGPPRDAMVLQAARLDLPGLLLRNRERLVDLGNVKREGRTLRGIGVPMAGNLNVAMIVGRREPQLHLRPAASSAPANEQKWQPTSRVRRWSIQPTVGAFLAYRL